MPATKRPLPITSAACALLLALLAGCATPMQAMQRDVGVVVVTPKVQIPPLPVIVLTTLPKPPGYFQSELLRYSSGSPEKVTTSTSPTHPAGPTR